MWCYFSPHKLIKDFLLKILTKSGGKQMTNTTEKKIIELIATDRMDIPVSSLSGKLKRMKPKIASAVEFSGDSFQGERVYARIENQERMKARGMRDAVERFQKTFPEYGQVLGEMIAEERASRETYLHFGVNSGCRLTAEDYLEVMQNLGFDERNALRLYDTLIDASRKISRARDEERSILIG